MRITKRHAQIFFVLYNAILACLIAYTLWRFYEALPILTAFLKALYWTFVR